MGSTYPYDTYRLLLVTRIPVYHSGDGYVTDGLWVRDLEGQVMVTPRLCLVAPLGDRPPAHARPLPRAIEVVTYDQLRTSQAIGDLVRNADVVQLAGNVPRWKAQMDLRFARAARAVGRRLVLSISSNRARTAVLNAQHKPWPSRVKARLTASSIVRVQRRLARMADGVLLTGHGLRSMLGAECQNVHVDTASWIHPDEIIDEQSHQRKMAAALSSPTLRICVATRLEPMKGVHLAVEAMKMLQERSGSRCPSLVIFGEGPEEARLQQMVTQYGLGGRVTFGGTFAYPQPFLDRIRPHDLILLTNLNDEQPRLIFDAISQGVVPLCPDSKPYRALDLDDRLFFRCGDAESLAHAIDRFDRRDLLQEVGPGLREMARHHTVQSMHQRRAQWIARIPRPNG